MHGRTNNPWNLDCTPGGSSGGESAAIAAGMSAGGLGSDSGGSVRVPAHFTGICSLKPTPGRIPGDGHLPPCIGHFRFSVPSDPWRGPSTTWHCCFARFRDTPLRSHESTNRGAIPSLDEVKRLTHRLLRRRRSNPGYARDSKSSRRMQCKCCASRDSTSSHFRPRGLEQARKLWELFFVRCGAMFEEPLVRGHEHHLSPVFRDFLARAHAADTTFHSKRRHQLWHLWRPPAF